MTNLQPGHPDYEAIRRAMVLRGLNPPAHGPIPTRLLLRNLELVEAEVTDLEAQRADVQAQITKLERYKAWMDYEFGSRGRA